MTMTSTTSVASSGTSSPAASSLLRSKSAPGKIQTSEDSDVAVRQDNFLSRTILAPILFLSFIFSLAIVDRKRSLEEDRRHGTLSKRRRLLYFSLYWRIPSSPDGEHPSHSNGGGSGTSSRRGSSDSGGSMREDFSGDKDKHGHVADIMTLAEKQKEARSLSAEAFSIQNRVMLGMGVFSIGFGLLCWVTYLKVKALLGFV
ncbi:hypothetical protein TWF694_011057 [Orbilia ellipsospora]|uniref:Uncharacterized protein n=1 Tax=Orbilia ellipsospora TaxID=2528407 RepID=A0AAV9X7X7_9PEZI